MMRRRTVMLACGLTAACVRTDADEPAAGEASTGDVQPVDDGSSTGLPAADTTTSASSDGALETSDGCAEPCGSSDGDSDDGGPTVESQCHDRVDEDGDGVTDCFDSDCWGDTECDAAFLRVATWNVRGLGEVGATEYTQLVAVVQRIDADVLCLQEVGDAEGEALDALAAATGYETVVVGPALGAATGMIRNACLSRVDVAGSAIVGAADISSDPTANDVTRAFLRLRINLQPSDRYVSVFAAHLKSGEEEVDRFRRMVEATRLAQAVEQERDTFPGNAIVVLGDFNEVPDPPASTFASLPAGLPFSYSLGDDIDLPLDYDPFAPLESASLLRTHAHVEDAPWTATYLPGLVRLDYIYQDLDTVVVAEVYEACEDDGVDDAPLGDVLPKAGEALRCGASADASDHRPVVAVFHVP
ncbi:MAG: endonuclease/exonuclease/phosphatase family protein [Myxococcota bacterium]